MDITTTLSDRELWKILKQTETSKAEAVFRGLANAFYAALEGECDDDGEAFNEALSDALFLAFRAGFEAASQ